MAKQMYIEAINLVLDWGGGPICERRPDETGRMVTGVPVIDNDPVTQRLCDEIWELYGSLYTDVPYSDDNHAGFEFDEDQYYKRAPKLLSLARELIARLDEINDGSFFVSDWMTDSLIDDVEGRAS